LRFDLIKVNALSRSPILKNLLKGNLNRAIDNSSAFRQCGCVYNIEGCMQEGGIQKLTRIMADECLAFRVRSLSRVITNIYDAALEQHGITMNQATMLIMLSYAGKAGPGRIGQVLIMEKSTVSRNLKLMKKQGWIEAVEGGTGRDQVMSATKKGKTLLTAFHPAWKKAQKETERLVGEKGVAAVHTLHTAVRKKHPI
jgi:DNA-binding MarR family transcriptional regulator